MQSWLFLTGVDVAAARTRPGRSLPSATRSRTAPSPLPTPTTAGPTSWPNASRRGLIKTSSPSSTRGSAATVSSTIRRLSSPFRALPALARFDREVLALARRDPPDRLRGDQRHRRAAMRWQIPVQDVSAEEIIAGLVARRTRARARYRRHTARRSHPYEGTENYFSADRRGETASGQRLDSRRRRFRRP